MWLGAAALTHQPPAVAVGGSLLAGVAALAPDIDHRGSTITRAFAIITVPLSWLVRHGPGGDHRHLTHSVAGWLVWSAGWLLAATHWGWPLWVAWALAAGWANHIVMDMLTISGCPLLWPRLVKYHLLPDGLRVRCGTRKKHIRGRPGKWHTAEYWIVRPLAVLALAGGAVLCALPLVHP
jgi:membrane-bound metal-dependent hydrolase YbcI (DUF457 family)